MLASFSNSGHHLVIVLEPGNYSSPQMHPSTHMLSLHYSLYDTKGEHAYSHGTLYENLSIRNDSPQATAWRRSIKSGVAVLSIFGAMIVFAVPAISDTNPWIGTYKSAKAEAFPGMIRSVSLTEQKDHSLKAQLELAGNMSDNSVKAIHISGVGFEYRNSDSNDFKDTVIISFPNSKFKPFLILRSGSFTAGKPKSFEYLDYTLYETSTTCYFYYGKVSRQKPMDTLK